MSKERELLYRWYNGAKNVDDFSDLYDKTEELLVQSEQEPVAWMCNLLGDVVTDKPADNNGYTALYKSPKREPLSCCEITYPEWAFTRERQQAFDAGVRFAEKEHGLENSGRI